MIYAVYLEKSLQSRNARLPSNLQPLSPAKHHHQSGESPLQSRLRLPRRIVNVLDMHVDRSDTHPDHLYDSPGDL